MEKVGKWGKNIVNHFCNCCHTCIGDVKKFKVGMKYCVNVFFTNFVQERWLGLLNHVQNEHKLIFARFDSCVHLLSSIFTGVNMM